MTRASHPLASAIAILLCLLAAGCGGEVDVFPESAGVTESADIMRQAGAGPIIVSFASYPMRLNSPPDGVRRAVARAIGRRPCSAAVFYWAERTLSERWIGEQLEVRRRGGRPLRLILAGHGLGATEAAELGRELLIREQDLEIVLLLTVDAVKTGRMSSAAGVTGAAIVNRLPGVSVSLAAYDAAPVPDGQRFWSHINYYQDKSPLYHGTIMPGAENHRLDDWTQLLNHGNADDFAYPLVAADLKVALERASL